MAEVLLYGAINKDGSIHAPVTDQNFKVTKEDIGLYRIDFEGLFSEMPAVVATQNFKDWDDFKYPGDNTMANAVLVSVDSATARIMTGATAGNHDDRNFAFVAIGKGPSALDIPTIAHGSIGKDNMKERGTDNFAMGPEQATGRYEIDFRDGLYNGPTAVVLTQHFNTGGWNNFKYPGGNSQDNTVLIAADESYAVALTGDGANGGVHDDRNFTFMAFGPGGTSVTLPRLAYGAVKADGEIVTGNGTFRIVHIGEGEYLIDFEAAGFNGMPTIMLTVNDRIWDDATSGRSSLNNAVLVAVDRYYARVLTGNPAPIHLDKNFAFIAMDV